MLSDTEIKAIEELIHHYPDPRAGGVDAMKIVQAQRGWVSNEHLADIAQLLGMTVHELDSLATFYNLIFRRPVGRHVILLCDSVSCWLLGYETILDALQRRLKIGFGETTEDKRFTLVPGSCIGQCDRAPAMIIDDEAHTNLTPENIEEILERYP